MILIQAIDAGDKKITVNAVAPGAIKTDMYQAVAREYIPGGESFTDEQVDQVWHIQNLNPPPIPSPFTQPFRRRRRP